MGQMEMEGKWRQIESHCALPSRERQARSAGEGVRHDHGG
jgi:hypothetical protein